ncbi:aldo/keto reductase [Candidatus Poribacteria bacterium]|nr:aldo/keto reductase [Candidatus Poribacteria bacterium]MBT5532789.1 aldo/keto reductase [Candidatus Poribacteria bacterium]MBT5711973.1 aldo/keto reductase [Candidatus Poribacteria bacterium]MBT7097771.1 aldo/keto reductase [Candidatus Poribacteria bacterium]MBT7808153.1 aldo/keto reductase [Candidatus Poribacteria bacterium]
MEHATLGRTGREVSRLGFGGAPAGLKNYLDEYDPARRDQREEVVVAIRRAVEIGVTYFDTAPGYGDGVSESIFGEALSGCAEDVFVATKIGASADGARRSLEGSLERLRRDHVDLVQIHGSSYSVEQTDAMLAPGGIVETLEALREEGLTRAIGFTTEDTNDSVYRLIRSGRLDVMQVCYNMIYQHPYEPTRPFGCILEADNAGMGVVTMRAMTSGILQNWIRAVNPDDSFDYNAALLRFVLANPLVDVALVGMRDADTVERNVAITDDIDSRIPLDRIHERYVDR